MSMIDYSCKKYVLEMLTNKFVLESFLNQEMSWKRPGKNITCEKTHLEQKSPIIHIMPSIIEEKEYRYIIILISMNQITRRVRRRLYHKIVNNRSYIE